jgi:hypothetical protein
VNRQIADETAGLAANRLTITPEPIKTTAAERRSQASYARRQARYEAAARLRATGMGLKRIAHCRGYWR